MRDKRPSSSVAKDTSKRFGEGTNVVTKTLKPARFNATDINANLNKHLKY